MDHFTFAANMTNIKMMYMKFMIPPTFTAERK